MGSFYQGCSLDRAFIAGLSAAPASGLIPTGSRTRDSIQLMLKAYPAQYPTGGAPAGLHSPGLARARRWWRGSEPFQ